MSILTDLQEARELILKEENWTQEVFARNSAGDKVNPVSSEACQWCALGALTKVSLQDRETKYADHFTRIDRYERSKRPLQDAAWYLYNGPPATVNDELTHKEVLAMFDLAIKRVKEQG